VKPYLKNKEQTKELGRWLKRYRLLTMCRAPGSIPHTPQCSPQRDSRKKQRGDTNLKRKRTKDKNKSYHLRNDMEPQGRGGKERGGKARIRESSGTLRKYLTSYCISD
jgi:hypothetical protein